MIERPPVADVRSGAGILVEVAERAGDGHGPGVRWVLAAQDPDQARLAGAVAAHEADLVAGAHGEARLDQREASTDLDGEVPGLEHRTSVEGAEPVPAFVTA